MTIHELPAGTHEKLLWKLIRLHYRCEKKADERATARFFWALITSSAVLSLLALACYFTGRLTQMPWQTHVSMGLVVTNFSRQLWKAYFTAASCAREHQQRRHEITMYLAGATSRAA